MPMPGFLPCLLTPVIFVGLAIGGCAQRDVRAGGTALASTEAISAQASPQDSAAYPDAAEEVGTSAPSRTDLPNQSLEEDILYKFLLAEIAGQRGNHQMAAQAYLELARKTRDPRLARRATEVALYGKNNPIALEAAKLWLETESQSAAARQTLAALFVSLNDLPAAKPLLAKILSSSGNIGQALEQLHPSLAGHPDKNAVLGIIKDLTATYRERPEAHLAVAQAYVAAGKYAEALVQIREAMNLRPSWETGALFQAQLLNRESRPSALAYLSDFLAAHPKAQEVRLAYARQLINDKNFAPARAEFQRLLDDNPSNGDIAITVALLSVQMNDFDVAETQLKRVLELDYKDPDAVRFHIGQVNEERKRFDEAAKWYLSVTQGEQFVSAHARYALMLARQNKLAEARLHLQGLVPLDEEQRIQILQSEAQLLREAKEYQESFNVLKKGLDAQPDQPELLYDVALAAEKIDRIDLVEFNLRRLLVLKPEHAQAYNALGYTLADRTERLTEAREYIEKALKLSPGDPFILDSMGWVEYRLGRLAASLQFLERAFQVRPDPEIAAHLGEVLWVKGDKAGAEKIWREALREHPESDELKKIVNKFLR